jgi:hypothetical protein
LKHWARPFFVGGTLGSALKGKLNRAARTPQMHRFRRPERAHSSRMVKFVLRPHGERFVAAREQQRRKPRARETSARSFKF